MTTTTALVETLTAEVRVLMLGKRQVTLSVAKQLDRVPLAELTLFGRVKLGFDNAYVIGVDRDGNLALAGYVPTRRWEFDNTTQMWHCTGPTGVGFHVRQPDGQIKWVSTYDGASVTDDEYQLHLAATNAPLIVLWRG